MSNIIHLQLKCEHAACSNLAEKSVSFEARNGDDINDYHVLMCKKCAESLIMQGYANRKLSGFSLTEYIPIETYFKLVDQEPDYVDI